MRRSFLRASLTKNDSSTKPSGVKPICLKNDKIIINYFYIVTLYSVRLLRIPSNDALNLTCDLRVFSPFIRK